MRIRHAVNRLFLLFAMWTVGGTTASLAKIGIITTVAGGGPNNMPATAVPRQNSIRGGMTMQF